MAAGAASADAGAHKTDAAAHETDASAHPVVPHCMFGADQSCNDNPALNSLHGTCNRDGTCTCHAQFAKNPKTGLCL
jgi:hypothetical protein